MTTRPFAGPTAALPRLAFIFGLLLFGACTSIEQVQPGTGRKNEIRDRSYEEIWRAALRVADEHFEIHNQDRGRGIIRAERTYHFMGNNGWIGIFITPAVEGADTYIVEAVFLKKVYGEIVMQKWERKILRDLHNALDGVVKGTREVAPAQGRQAPPSSRSGAAFIQ